MLEVLIAVTIFAIVASSLYTTFRVGIRAYESGQREINRMQHARVIFDTISRDLRCIFYRSETSYNNTLRRELSRFEQEWNRAEEDGRLDEFLYGDEDDPESPGAKNPYEYGIEIDLGFRGENSRDQDGMTFVRYQYDDGITMTQPWSLGRISYQMEDDALVRLEEDIIQPMKDYEGNVLEEKIPRRDVLARGVRRFELFYGFFYDEDWMEAEDWDSSAKRYRNPTEELDEEDPLYEEKLSKQQLKPTDGLPAYIRVIIEIEDEKRPRADNKKGASGNKKVKTQTYSTLIRIPMALENYLPSLEDDEDD